MIEAFMTIGAVAGMTGVVYGLGRLATVRQAANVTCPVKRVPAHVDFNHRTGALWEAGQRCDVLRCSALANPERVDCGKDCLGAPRAQRAK